MMRMNEGPDRFSCVHVVRHSSVVSPRLDQGNECSYKIGSSSLRLIFKRNETYVLLKGVPDLKWHLAH